jgi:hypothetical protein
MHCENEKEKELEKRYTSEEEGTGTPSWHAHSQMHA